MNRRSFIGNSLCVLAAIFASKLPDLESAKLSPPVKSSVGDLIFDNRPVRGALTVNYGGTEFSRLAVGSPSQVLRSNSCGELNWVYPDPGNFFDSGS